MNFFTRARALLAMLAASLLMLAGCGGGSESDSSMGAPVASSCGDAAGCGVAYIAMTDADGDFLSYTVDVVSLSLRRANGTVVETLPNRTRVDFAQYVDLTEFITVATIPNGSYVEGTLRLDYTNAAVTVEQNGQPVATRVVGANGSALGIVDVRVVLDNRNHLVVSPGRPSLLTLDFNLAATNIVDLATTPVTVTARPTLIASLEPVEEKELRVRGPLVSVDVAGSTYTIDVRPFNHPHARHGRVVVHTTNTTAFEVDGQSSTGAAGLQALSAAGAGTATAAFGTLTTPNRTFTAERVHAGSSVPGQGRDTVIGTILSRTGNELVVRGGTIVRDLEPNTLAANARDDRAVFDRGDIRVLVGPNTVVLKDGFGTQATGAQALSVGQLIHAHGSVSNSSGQNVIDATQGRVRMHLTNLFGSVVSNNPGLLTLNLSAINGRRISAFNFAGTGVTPAEDANPVNYDVATPPFTVMQFLTGRPMRAIGFVTPFGAAPPDFEARTLVSYAELRAQLAIGWGDAGTTAPFTSMNATGLVLNLANPDIGLRHHIHLGPIALDLQSLAASPTIVGASTGQTMFVIATASGLNHYSNFADFVSALTTSLNGSRIVSFTASGAYDQAAGILIAKEAVAILR
jgi:hypothetical protein